MSFLVVYVWRGYKKSVYQKTIVETRYSITEVKQPVAARPKGGGRRPSRFEILYDGHYETKKSNISRGVWRAEPPTEFW